MQSPQHNMGVRTAGKVPDFFQIHAKLIPAGQPKQNILLLLCGIRQQLVLPHRFD